MSGCVSGASCLQCMGAVHHRTRTMLQVPAPLRFSPPSLPPPLLLPPAPQDTESVYSVNWAYGAVVKTEVNTTTGALAVTLFGDKGPRPIRPCRDLQLGPKASGAVLVESERSTARRCALIVHQEAPNQRRPHTLPSILTPLVVVPLA